jgi:hypothetical protein
MAQRKSTGVISQDAFRVAPHLIGLPLASGKRRAAAMLIDLMLVAFLVNIGGSVLFGLAAAYVFFRVASGRAGSRLSPRLRGVLRTGGALVLFVLAVDLYGSVFGGDDDEVKDEKKKPVAAAAAAGGPSALRAVLGSASVIRSSSELQEARDLEGARTAARQVRGALLEVGMTEPDVDQALRQMAGEAGRKSFVAQALREVAGPAAPSAEKAAPIPPDSLAVAWAAALRRADTAGAAALRAPLAAAVAGDTLDELSEKLSETNEDLAKVRGELAEANQRAEDAEEAGILHVLARVADELGLSFGWVGLYFTACLALMRGQTPGKRMMGVRVMRLDGAPISFWAAFERFGGYAASIFTGLLGFAQILWDHNRQGMHDKIVETVVVRVVPGLDPVAPAPNAAPAAAAL